MTMNAKDGVPVISATAIAAPASFALPAIELILKEFTQCPGRASLALNIRDLHVPFEAMISVPIETHVRPGEHRNQWRLRIRAAQNVGLYPAFEGLLTLLSADNKGSQLQLEGSYAPPMGSFGSAIDRTVFHGAAKASLDRFVRNIASRVATLSQWVQVV